jgi:deoxyribonuclease V
MKTRKLHEWNISTGEASRVQKKLRELVVEKWDGRGIGTVAGADVSFPSREEALAAVCVLSYPALELLDWAVAKKQCTFPYVPGFLAFREIPALLEALARISVEPDVILCDAQGLAHPRGMGLATHLGIILDRPTVGCAKSRLFGNYVEPGMNRGDRSPLLDSAHEVIGTVLRTRSGVKPVFVSTGNLVDIETSVNLVLGCCPRYRLPETTRIAHRLAAGERFEIG